jgi:hypothetical protein
MGEGDGGMGEGGGIETFIVFSYFCIDLFCFLSDLYSSDSKER